jgi:hypothetical protein
MFLELTGLSRGVVAARQVGGSRLARKMFESSRSHDKCHPLESGTVHTEGTHAPTWPLHEYVINDAPEEVRMPTLFFLIPEEL